MDNKILFSKYRNRADIKGAKTYKVARVVLRTGAAAVKPKLKLAFSFDRALKAAKILFILTAVAGLGYGVYFGADRLKNSPGFEVKEVKVTGNKYVSKNEILALAKVEIRKNMFGIKLKDIQSRLKANPQFKTASVNRVFPGTVEIEVSEREPVAYLGENKFYQADAEGIIFPSIKSFFYGKRLYSFTGINISLSEVGKKTTSLSLKQALLMAEKLETKGAPYLNDVMSIDVSCPEELALVVQNTDQVYKFGEGNWDEKIDKLICLLKNLNERKKDIAYVDLRFRDEAVVSFKNNKIN
ncbi:MAG: FtsQ-type POTRA domain-containing protein [Candidatus Firestonebacteria bacterium]